MAMARSTMKTVTDPKVVDGNRIQRFMGYLVLLNIFMVLLYTGYLRHLNFGDGMLLPALLIIYNLLLCKLVTKRARRQGDVHIIYVVTLSSIAACLVLLYYFFA